MSDNEEECDFHVSKELLEKEKEYHIKNKNVQKKSVSLVKEAEKEMKEKRKVLDTPISQLHNNASRAAEPEHYTRARPSTSAGSDSVKPIRKRPSTATPKVHNLNPATSPNSLPLEELEYQGQDLNQETINRLLKMRIQVLQTNLDKILHDYTALKTKNSNNEERVKYLESENIKFTKKFQGSQAQVESLNRVNMEMSKAKEGLQTELANLKKEFDNANKNQKVAENDINLKDVRLNRALEELEKLKKIQSKVSTQSKEKIDQSKKTLDNLTLALKKTEKQKNDLMVIFKKQVALIDVLKRQLKHLECSKMLEFTEAEFLRILNVPTK